MLIATFRGLLDSAFMYFCWTHQETAFCDFTCFVSSLHFYAQIFFMFGYSNYILDIDDQECEMHEGICVELVQVS